jgi:hypothetical protein
MSVGGETVPLCPVLNTWLGYLAVSGIEHDSDSVLMPIAINHAIARQCARSFDTGHPGLILIPVVIGPGNTPPPDAPGAQHIAAELAVLGALNGTLDLTDPKVRRNVLDTLTQTGIQTRTIYTRIIYLTASPAVQQALEEDLAITDYRVEFLDAPIEQAEARGRAAGEGEMLLHILQTRGFTVPESIRERVNSCADTAQLQAWADLALTARSLGEIFS